MASVNPKRFKLADYERNLWVITTEADTTLDDVLKNDYFAHCAAQMKPFDRIEVRNDEEKYYAELLVRSAGKNWAVCIVLTHLDLEPKAVAEEPESPDYKVGWAGPHQKFRVIRLTDNQVVHQGCDTKEAANAWLAEHLKAITR